MKREVLLGIVIIGAVVLSGCTNNSEPPPGYPSRSTAGNINIELIYDHPIFYFGDVVQDNGSVNQSKTVNWTLTINNHGDGVEDVRFDVLYFPPEPLIWSTTVAYKYNYITYPEYDYDRAEFERQYIDDLPSMVSVDFTVSITFDKTVAWSYSPDTTYVGYFEIGKRAINPECNNIYYEGIVVPFVVRT